MFDKIYKAVLGVAIVFFSAYWVFKWPVFGFIAGVILFIDALMKVIYDWRKGRLAKYTDKFK